MDLDLPKDLAAALDRVRATDKDAAEHLHSALSRLLRAADALTWARDRLSALVTAPTEGAVLQVVVDEAKTLTQAPEAWAITWAQQGDTSRVRALAGGSGTGRTADGQWVTPTEISQSVLGKVVEDGRPAWSDDAMADARFLGAHSVQALALRSVGCVPLGARGALYLHDPETPGRFSARARARISALCALAAQTLGAPDDALTDAPRRKAVEPLPGLVGSAPAMEEAYTAIRAFAPMPWPVLILGETGTGKEAAAAAVHDLSGRSGPFVAVNCGTLAPELAESTLFGHERGAFTGADRARGGLVERATSGTLFLDEVGELPAAVQTKLLRLLQEGTYRRLGDERERRFAGRIVAATHRDVAATDGPDSFRADLYHRLSACVVRMPALRRRTSDLPELAAHLLRRTLAEVPDAPQLTLSDDVLAELRRRSWPGNVRQLVNVLRGGVALAIARGDDALRVSDLAPAAGGSADPGSWPSDLMAATELFQQARVRMALTEAEGNKTQAATALGVSRQWLHRLIARWDQQGPW
ncbi:MAG: sigma 54-interacting transcriptional regulator [Myxococcales bacterium]|nr:sigma 54-interacting transcriptional regulator [Myxococcales bacterium]